MFKEIKRRTFGDCRGKNVTRENNEKIKEGKIERSITDDQERTETKGVAKI